MLPSFHMCAISYRQSALSQQLVEVKVMFAQLPAVVPGRNLDHARTARGPDTDPHRLSHRFRRQAVDDDLKYRPDPLRQFALHRASQRWAEGRIAGGVQKLVARADLAAGSYDAARKRHDDAGHLPHRLDRPLSGPQGRRQLAPQQQEVTPRYALLDAKPVFHNKFAVHDGNSPKPSWAAAVADDLRLKALADLRSEEHTSELQ